ncbi:pseudouridine synthase [Luteibaculum oceani]|uniref:rRNA pseudouridine synthase n=1 Tax=Luteibaculum oceani TaxID=1294296 RepID=A0A5C6VI31_9FLAO|nr:pseudouridine synthase [Luteibaculum oceani]TXC85092.1 rRNA pseudouridine synthase [Luteibaculum oceani]
MGRERSNWRDKGSRRGAQAKREDSRQESGDKPRGNKPFKPGFKKEFRRNKGLENIPKFSSEVRLNKFLSNAGVCGRREADVLIKSGAVSVNDVHVTELGIKVNPDKDVVKVDGNRVSLETKQYFVLNKPKDFNPLMGDPYSRKTVSILMKGACKEQIYPVDKVDKMTSGVLLFSNDGDLIIKLSHPKFRIKRIYHVTLNRKFAEQSLEEVKEGLEIDGHFFKPEAIEFVGKGDDRTQVGLEITTGRHSVVRKVFEHFGCKVVAMDRVYFGGITKKNLPRGKYRKLTEQEVINLKMMK